MNKTSVPSVLATDVEKKTSLPSVFVADVEQNITAQCVSS